MFQDVNVRGRLVLMSCYVPILAVNLGINSETQKRRVKILPKRVDYNLQSLRSRYGDSLLLLPCGKCVGCLQDYRSSWAVRILLEASLYDCNSFITLTYRDECLPKDNKPHRDEIVLFLKRLRKAIYKQSGQLIRVFYTGEKGEKSGRAHYHAIIFGYDFPDKVLQGRTSSGSVIYRSPLLESCWEFGNSSVGEVEPGSACYVASYCNKKKLTGIDDGSFVGMSRRPGLGADKFNMRWFKSDTIYCALGEPTIPRFFHKLLEGLDPKFYNEWKESRLERCKERVGNQFIYGFQNEEECLQYDEYNKLILLSKKRSKVL